MCKTPCHGQKSGSCPFRECSKCKQVGHSARECQKQSDRTIESDVDGRNTMDVANDQDADTCTMSVDGQSDDDGNHMSERGASDRRQECDRSNLSNANEHEHDDDEDIEDTRTRDASIAMDMRDESDDGERTMERGDPNGEQPPSDEDDDGDDADENGQGYTIVVTEFQKRGLPHAHIPPPQVEHTGGKPGDHQPHMDKPAVSSSSIKTPKSKPKTRQRDPEVVAVDSL